MKIIDLLNKIANDEELPEIIKVRDTTYYLCESKRFGCRYFSEKKGFGGVKLSFDTSVMNEKVEIIEEDKKIYKLDWVEGNTFNKIQENSYLSRKEIQLLDSNFKELGNKINEIIEEINKLKDDRK